METDKKLIVGQDLQPREIKKNSRGVQRLDIQSILYDIYKLTVLDIR